MKFMLDTNICIYLIKKHPANVLKKLESQLIQNVCISSITLAELMFGVEKSLHKEKNKAALNEFILPLEIVDFDYNAANHYGEIRAYLEAKGKLIGSLDLMIAAHARSLGLTLITNNEKEFSRVQYLKIDNWS